MMQHPCMRDMDCSDISQTRWSMHATLHIPWLRETVAVALDSTDQFWTVSHFTEAMFPPLSIHLFVGLSKVLRIFLRERDYVTFGSLLSQIRLSSVTFVRPTHRVETFCDISSPFCTLVILWPPCRILRRLSRGNPPSGALNARGVAE